MIKLTDFSPSELSQFISTYQETSLSLKLNIKSNDDLPLLFLIYEELGKLLHLREFNIVIPKNIILTEKGYELLSNAIIHLSQLNKLAIIIENNCQLQIEGLRILTKMIINLPGLIYLKLHLGLHNQISTETAQYFLDSLSAKKANLTTLKLYFVDINSISTNERNIHFWRGLQDLVNLQKLSLWLNEVDNGESDLIELFAILVNLKMLKHCQLKFKLGTMLLDNLFTCIGQMIGLTSLKVNLNNAQIYLTNIQKRQILRNLSNLKSLESLRLNSTLEDLLIFNNLDEYINVIKDLKQLKTLSLRGRSSEVINRDQMMSLCRNVYELKNIANLELVLENKYHYWWNELFFKRLLLLLVSHRNLLSLNISISEITENEIIILARSFHSLESLEKLRFQLKALGISIVGILKNIRYLTKLKYLEIYQGNQIVEQVFFESLSSLNLLEHFKMRIPEFTSEKFGFSGFENLEALCNALQKLRKLKSLGLPIKIKDLNNQQQLELLEKSFENLQELSKLTLDLNIDEKSNDLKNISIIKYLPNLKEININYLKKPFSILDSSLNQVNIKRCTLKFERETETSDFIQILESLSEISIKRLIFNVYLINYENYQEQFRLACSKLPNIHKLSTELKYYFNYGTQLFYQMGIKEMKSLKSLDLNYRQFNMVQKEIKVIEEVLESLTSLSNLKICFRSDQHISDALEIFSHNDFHSLENLKRFQIQLNCYDYHLNRQKEDKIEEISFAKALNLDIEQHLPKIIKDKTIQQIIAPISNADIQSKGSNLLINSSQLLKTELIQNEEYKQKIIQMQQLIPIKLILKINSRKNSEYLSSLLYQLDLLNAKYLNTLVIQFQAKPGDILQEWQLKQWSGGDILEHLTVNLNELIFSQDLIMYISDNLQSFKQLKSLSFQTQSVQDYYFLLFDSFKYLKNLCDLTVETDISENGTVSLGNSLKAMNKLQNCHLKFNENSQFEIQGMSSIFNGLKNTQDLKELHLNLITKETMMVTDADSQIKIGECISNLRNLQSLDIKLRTNIVLNSICFCQFMSSISSLAYLNSLILMVNEFNPFNQDMIDDLIKSINSIQYLNCIMISIHLQSDQTIKVSQEYAKMFNTLSSCKLDISTYKNKITLNQENCYLKFSSNHMENVELTFLEYLTERKEVRFNISERKIFKHNIKCVARKIVFISDNEINDKQGEFQQVCQFLSRNQNVLELIVKINLGDGLNRVNSITTLLQNLQKLNSLKELNIIILQQGQQIDSQQLKLSLDFLKKMKQFQALYFKTGSNQLNLELVKIIKRTALRFVNFSEIKQDFYYKK